MRSGPTELGEHDVSVALDEEGVAGTAQDVQRDLVRHRRRRQKDRLLLAEELGPDPLELVDGRVLALLLVADDRGGDRLPHPGRGLGKRVGAQIDHRNANSALGGLPWEGDSRRASRTPITEARGLWK